MAKSIKESSDDERQYKRSKTGRKHIKNWTKNFTYMQKHDGSTVASNPNTLTIEILERMITYYNQIGDHWRITAYRRVIGVLNRETRKISSKKKTLEIPFVGERLASKIKKIVRTNGLQRLDDIDKDFNKRALRIFLKIYRAGHTIARK